MWKLTFDFFYPPLSIVVYIEKWFINISSMGKIIINPIGVIRTPHTNIKNMPIQPIAAEGIKGHIELLPEYVAGLKDLEGFSHITLVYHFHKIVGFRLEVIPFMDDQSHGIFASKAPKRPNAIGISTVKLIAISGNIIHIEQVDMLDKTPLIDIKPFYPRYDNRENVKIGWLEKNKNLPVEKLRADDRFR
jgi:tRNA-Thr(GGU) m(6)t(6)A37 methyltransferase TsaA